MRELGVVSRLFIQGAVLLGVLFFAGCSSKTFYNKPSVFFSVGVPKEVSSNECSATTSDCNKSLVRFYCLDKDSEIVRHDDNVTIGSKLDSYGNCTGYYTLDVSCLFARQTEDGNSSDIARQTARRLMVLSDKNCVTFTNSFYLSNAVVGGGFKVLDLNLFGVAGINFGGIKEYTSSQLVNMSNSITLNLEKRKTFRTKITNKINSNMEYKFLDMIGDITAYDNLCSVLNTNGIATDESGTLIGTFTFSCPDGKGGNKNYRLFRDGNDYYEENTTNSSYKKIDGYMLRDNNISIDLISGNTTDNNKSLGKCTMPTTWVSPLAK